MRKNWSENIHNQQQWNCKCLLQYLNKRFGYALTTSLTRVSVPAIHVSLHHLQPVNNPKNNVFRVRCDMRHLWVMLWTNFNRNIEKVRVLDKLWTLWWINLTVETVYNGGERKCLKTCGKCKWKMLNVLRWQDFLMILFV